MAGIFGWPLDQAGAVYRYSSEPGGLDYAPVCQSANGSATAGLRLKAFTEAFGANGSFVSICQDDFRPALQNIGARLGSMLNQ